MIHLTKTRKPLFDAAVIREIYHDHVHLPQRRLGVDEFLPGAAGDRDLRALSTGSLM
jgi:hypothetical protein